VHTAPRQQSLAEPELHDGHGRDGGCGRLDAPPDRVRRDPLRPVFRLGAHQRRYAPGSPPRSNTLAGETTLAPARCVSVQASRVRFRLHRSRMPATKPRAFVLMPSGGDYCGSQRRHHGVHQQSVDGREASGGGGPRDRAELEQPRPQPRGRAMRRYAAIPTLVSPPYIQDEWAPRDCFTSCSVC